MRRIICLRFAINALTVLAFCFYCGCSGCSEETANNDVLYSDVTDIQVSDIKTTDIEKNNPCKGVECSGHGVCAVINDEKAVCICDKGYEQDPDDPTICKAVSCTPNCKDKECGSDGCGGECGRCNTDEFCNNEYKCIKKGPGCPDTKDCSNRECGPDPVCGENCGVCGDNKECNAEGKCVCKPFDSCEKALLTAGVECGEVDDGCGKKMDCTNVCKFPETCGGGGIANMCGGNCTPKYADCISALSSAGIECGMVDDGCGRQMDCTNVCVLPKVCGGVEPNKCGDPCQLAGDPPCSGNGKCKVQDNMAVCICNEGYVNQGLDCIPDPNLCQPYCEPGKYCDKTTKTCKPLPVEVISLDESGLVTFVKSIKINSKGDVFVGGMFVQPKSLGQIYFESMVAFLYKLDSGNNIKFKKTWDIPKKIDMVTSISIDSLDNVYTTGCTDVAFSNGGGSIEIIKWKSDGSRDITFNTGETIEGTYYTPVPVDSTAVISGGTPYLYTVSSKSKTPQEGIYFDVVVNKINMSGNGAIEWSKTIPNASVGQTTGRILSDSEGNIYVIGSAQDNIFGTTNYTGGMCVAGCGGQAPCTDTFVVKFNSNGDVLWAKIFGKTGQNETPYAGAILGENIYFVFNAGGMDYYFYELSAKTGVILRSTFLNKNMQHFAVDTAQNFFFVGLMTGNYDGNSNWDTSNTWPDVLVEKYNPNGQKVMSWMWGYDTPPTFYENLTAVGGGGNPFSIYFSVIEAQQKEKSFFVKLTP